MRENYYVHSTQSGINRIKINTLIKNVYHKYSVNLISA